MIMKKILIAEDNDSNFILMTYILKKYYQYERAKNGQEAVEMADKNSYDIVLMVKTHAAEGAKLLRSVLADVDDREYVKIATNIAHYHHEKYDGSGYPDHLSGEEIPFEARIMALPDVFDQKDADIRTEDLVSATALEEDLSRRCGRTASRGKP